MTHSEVDRLLPRMFFALRFKCFLPLTANYEDGASDSLLLASSGGEALLELEEFIAPYF